MDSALSQNARPTGDETYWRRLREMTPAQRLRAAFDLSESIRDMARAGIRAQFPQFTEAVVAAELRRRI